MMNAARISSRQPVTPHLLAKGGAVQTKELGGGGAVSSAVPQDCFQKWGLDELQELFVELRIVGRRQARGFVRRPAGNVFPRPIRGGNRRGRRHRGWRRQVFRADFSSPRNDRRVLDRISQFADVP